MKKFFLLAVLLPFLSFAQERIMVISDPHVIPQTEIDKKADFDKYMKTQRKMLELSEPIWHALLDTALKYKPDLVLIPGDLTKDGEAAEHDTVSAGIHRLEAAGIPTLVIPGNHDIPGEDWETLYSGTFKGAVKDPGSHSFASEPLPGLTVIGIDGSDGKAGTGKLSAATREWIAAQAKAAVDKGNKIIAMSHWQILEHFDGVGSLEPASRYDKPDEIRDLLMHNGIHVVLTGHFHVSGITTFRDTTGLTNDSLVEITTGSPITYPCPYRWMTLSADRKSLEITTDSIRFLTGIEDFTPYSKEWMREHTQNLVPSLAKRFWGKILDNWDEKIGPELKNAGLGSMATVLKEALPQTEDEQIRITEQYMSEPAINLYLFYSQANESKHKKEGKALAKAMDQGMIDMLTELLGMDFLAESFYEVIKPEIEGPVQSLIQDKTLLETDFADVTDDLELLLGEKTVIPAKFYLTGDSAFVVDAGLTEDKKWTPDAIRSDEDSYTLKLKGGVDYQLKLTVDGTWETVKGFNELTEKAEGVNDVDGDNHNIGFRLTEDGNVTVTYTGEVFKLEGKFYVEPKIKYYITGDAALVGAELAWNPAAIEVKEDSYTFKALAKGDYKLKVTLDGKWATAKGFDDLTEPVTENLRKDNDGNICFTLAEKGDVKVTYTEEVFKVEGKFVAPDPTVVAKGSWDSWAAELKFDLAKDKKTATLTIPALEAATYEFKVVITGDWRSNAAEFTRENPSAKDITGNDATNMKLVADIAGDYILTWTFADNSLAIEFPELPVEEKITLFVVNKLEWEKVFAYVWEGEKVLAAWPGIQLEKAKPAEVKAARAPFAAEADVYEFECPKSYTNIIFNNGTDEQTVDLTWQESKPYFVLSAQKDSEGHYEGDWKTQSAATDIDNIADDAKATKRIINGQLFIIKGDKIYNVQGQQITK